MSETSQALEFTNVKLNIQVDGDLPGDEQHYPIHNMVQLRLALNRLELDPPVNRQDSRRPHCTI